jgi:CheY-like chemotaxis protein
MRWDKTTPAGRAGRILVVEDSPSARRLLQDVLIRLGVELPNLRLAGSVLEALTTFTNWRPNVVFVDIELRPPPTTLTSTPLPPSSPNDPKDGAELAQLFLTRNPSVRVIVCSAADPSDPRIAKLVQAGRVDFITKPLLAARIEAALERAVPPTPVRSR